jgi:putative colanic acid biosynthesis UDP-glucose lipid carrier transferase
MVQRFSDIIIILFGLYLVFYLNGKDYGYNQILASMIVLVLYQMTGGITDFYRSWRGVKFSSEFILVLKNWTVSILLSLGVLSYLNGLWLPFQIFIEWFILVCVCLLFSRMSIRAGARIIRHLGYNTRNVAIAGSMPVGLNLAKSFIEEPWLGFKVVGIYDTKTLVEEAEEYGIEYKGDFDALVQDARAGHLDRIYCNEHE